MAKKDYYEILGVKKDASADELKKQYRRLSLLYHPDRQAGKSDAEKKAAEEKFKEISEAYAVLSDQDKRQKYDQFGDADFQGGFDFGGDGFDPMEFFRKMRGGMGGFDPFDDFGFGGGSRHGGRGMASSAYDPNAPEDGGSYETGLSVSFKESVFGCKKDLRLDVGEECPECHGSGCAAGTSPKACPDCGGTGQVSKVTRTGMMIHRVISACPTCRGTGVSFEPCWKCGGAKRIPRERKVTVTIPAGAADGTRLRLAGCGQCGVKGGRPGDVYVRIAVESSPIFDRRGNDIYFTAYVPSAVAVLGGKVKVPTLYGYRDIKIEPGTQAGAKLKVAGYGVRSSAGSGSMVITVVPEMPSCLSAEQKKVWEKALKLDKPENYERMSAVEKAAKEFYS